MNEALAYRWARQALKPVEKVDILELYKYQQIADKIVAAILDAYKLGQNEKLLRKKNIIMTDKQKYQLEKAIELIEDALSNEDANLKFLAVGLSVAGDYCKEIAKEMIEIVR